MRVDGVVGACLWLGACAGHTPSPAAQDRAQCLAEQTGRLGVGPDARATAELLCSASFTNTHGVDAECQNGRAPASDGGCSSE